MDSSDLQDIGDAIGEFFDQTCVVSHQGSALGEFGCLVLPQPTGTNPAVQGGSVGDLSTWQIYLPTIAAEVVENGRQIATSRGLDLTITGNDKMRSINAFLTVVASKQESSAPYVDLVLSHWDVGQKRFIARPAIEVQIVTSGNQPATSRDPSTGVVRIEQQGTIIARDLNADIRAGDRFEFEGDPGRVTSVERSDRLEASMILTRG